MDRHTILAERIRVVALHEGGVSDLAPYANLPFFQPHLLFQWSDFRVLRLYETMLS
jgi:hypothetical protein